VEALQRYDLSGPFGRRVLHDPGHWVRLLGGGLLQNVIPHSVCRIASFLEEGAALSVHASWLRRGTDFPSDLHAVFATPGRSATLTFITGASPAGSLFRVHGTKGILELDCRTQTIRSERNGGVPQLLARLSAPAVECRRGAVNFARVGRRLLRGDLRCFAGMGALFAAFYEAIESDGPAPVPYAELLRSIAIMDRLFEACERS
jgi:predicted dehydrogenase